MVLYLWIWFKALCSFSLIINAIGIHIVFNCLCTVKSWFFTIYLFVSNYLWQSQAIDCKIIKNEWCNCFTEKVCIFCRQWKMIFTALKNNKLCLHSTEYRRIFDLDRLFLLLLNLRQDFFNPTKCKIKHQLHLK